MSAMDTLLRFLTKDAKLPLATAISQAKGLQQAKLTSLEDIAQTDYETLKSISTDDKTAKHVLTAAKRITIKRKRGESDETAPSPTKRRKSDGLDIKDPAETEATLELPTSTLSEEDLSNVILTTNRAPLLLAFAACLLKYTMPEQPPSSRLSLAQGVTSINAKGKAASIGISKGNTAESEGWGQGQSSVKVLGRDIRVLKRWAYEWKGRNAGDSTLVKTEEPDQKEPATDSRNSANDLPALWALDLEQLKHLNGPLAFTDTSNAAGLPVYSPASAHSYILRAFDTTTSPEPAAKRKSSSQVAAEREANLGHLVKALDLLFHSWSGTLESSDLDQRAWNWYVKIRPQVESGAAGWGAKGQVKLKDILDLRRTT